MTPCARIWTWARGLESGGRAVRGDDLVAAAGAAPSFKTHARQKFPAWHVELSSGPFLFIWLIKMIRIRKNLFIYFLAGRHHHTRTLVSTYAARLILVFLHEPVHKGRQVAIDVCISGLTWPHFSHVLPLFHPSVRHLHGGLGHQINLTNITYSREYLYSIYTQEDICRIYTPSLMHIWVY